MSTLTEINFMEAQESSEGRAKFLKQFGEREQKAVGYLQKLVNEQPKALNILYFIFDNMDEDNALVCNYKVLEETFGYSISTIKRCIKYLKDNKYLYVYKTGVSNIYLADDRLVWEPYGDTEFSTFHANVIISTSEQEQKAGEPKWNKMPTNVMISRSEQERESNPAAMRSRTKNKKNSMPA